MNPPSILSWIDSTINSGNLLPMKARYPSPNNIFNQSYQNEIFLPTALCNKNYFKYKK
jgi:hypothetical protein